MQENQQLVNNDRWYHAHRENYVEDIRQKIEHQGTELDRTKKNNLNQVHNQQSQKNVSLNGKKLFKIYFYYSR